MFSGTLDILNNASKSKIQFLDESKGKYLVASLLAGLYVGLGIFLIMSIGGLTKGSGPFFKIFMGMGFGVALSLVLAAGSELFTGNNLILGAGAFSGAVKVSSAIKIWIYSYIGNLIGSILVGWLFVASNVAGGKDNLVGNFIVALSKGKMGASSGDLFFRGVLCNILVCLAVLCYLKLKDESAKLIMVFWCLFAFITSGYEHSIANMSIFTAGLLLPHGDGVTLAGAIHNLTWVTLGNLIGGGLLGVLYAYMGSNKNK